MELLASKDFHFTLSSLDFRGYQFFFGTGQLSSGNKRVTALSGGWSESNLSSCKAWMDEVVAMKALGFSDGYRPLKARYKTGKFWGPHQKKCIIVASSGGLDNHVMAAISWADVVGEYLGIPPLKYAKIKGNDKAYVVLPDKKWYSSSYVFSLLTWILRGVATYSYNMTRAVENDLTTKQYYLPIESIEHVMAVVLNGPHVSSWSPTSPIKHNRPLAILKKWKEEGFPKQYLEAAGNSYHDHGFKSYESDYRGCRTIQAKLRDEKK